MTLPSRSLIRRCLKHVLRLLVAFVVGCGFVYVMMQVLCAAAGVFRSDGADFAAYAKPTKLFLIVPLALAAIPFGLVAAQWVIWLIPAARRFCFPEAAARSQSPFAFGDRFLFDLALYSIVPLLGLSASAAFFGK